MLKALEIEIMKNRKASSNIMPALEVVICDINAYQAEIESTSLMQLHFIYACV